MLLPPTIAPVLGLLLLPPVLTGAEVTPCAPEKAVMGDPAGDRAGAGPGDRGGPPICPPEFCTVLMAWLMPLLMACTAMLRAR